MAVDSKLGQVQLERERGRWTQHAGQSERETSSPDGQRWVLQVSGKYPPVAQPSMSCAQGPEGGHLQSQKERGAQLPLQPAPRRLDILKKALLRQMSRSKVSSAGPAGVLRGCPRMVTASHLPQPAVDRQGKDPVEESPFHILPLQWQTNRTTRRVPSTSGSPSRRTTKTHKNQKNATHQTSCLRPATLAAGFSLELDAIVLAEKGPTPPLSWVLLLVVAAAGAGKKVLGLRILEETRGAPLVTDLASSRMG